MKKLDIRNMKEGATVFLLIQTGSVALDLVTERSNYVSSATEMVKNINE